MSTTPTPVDDRGMVWITFDAGHDDYLCYWYSDAASDRLVATTRAVSAADAVAWGRVHTPIVRIHLGSAGTYWAGPGRLPEGFVGHWVEDQS